MNPMICWLMVAVSAFLLWFTVPMALFPHAPYEQWRRKGTEGVLEVPSTAREWQTRKGRHRHQYRALLDGTPVLINLDFSLPLNSRTSAIYDAAALTTYANRNSEFGAFDQLILGSLTWDSERLRIENHDENPRHARYIVAFALVTGVGFGWSGIRELRRK